MKTAAQLTACILVAWAVGWFALRAIDQSDRDLSLPPKPIPKCVEMFLLWLPVTVAITVSGNAHAPSEAGLWIGLLVQWTAVGVLFFFFGKAFALLFRKLKSDAKKA